MLQDLSFYGTQILLASLWSFTALIALALLIAGCFAFLIGRRNMARWHPAAGVLLVLAALVLLTFNFYNTTIDIEEDLALLDVAKEFPDDAECGTASTGFIPAGIGLLNPCKKGCYRGITVKRTLRVRGLPPRPQYSREFQCWVRKDPDKDVLPEKYQDLIQ